MSLLDRPEIYLELDPGGLRRRIRQLPKHCEEGWRRARSLESFRAVEPIDRVMFGGMGGSAIAGDLVVDLTAGTPGVSMTVVRGFDLPSALDHRSLAVMCSYSGNTEETLALFRRVIGSGAKVLVVGRGGQLREEAHRHQVPFLEIGLVGEPRSAVGYNLLLLLGALDHWGIASTGEHELGQAIEALEQLNSRCGEEVPTIENPAKQLAADLLGHAVVVCGGGIFSGVGRRWKTQLNENAKVWAFFEELPELLHNTVEAFGDSRENGQSVAVVLLRPQTANPELLERFGVLAAMLDHSGLPYRELAAVDGPPLAQVLGMLSFGDWVSYYLALLRGVDPSPTLAIDRSKETLARLRKQLKS